MRRARDTKGARAPWTAAAAIRGVGFVACAWVSPMEAQHEHPSADSARVSVGAMGVGLYSRATPGPLGVTISEGYLTQPMAFATWRAGNDRLVAFATLNAEGATLDRGEINPGVYGEGYVDRRHPHTWAHELMIGTRATVRGTRWSLFAGKGFVPYGTDDPMVRPFVKYPVNHHHAQLLERAMLTGAAGWRSVVLEAATFNGDEPESPSDWPNADRSFDSWSARLTLTAAGHTELSASVARVKSPEFAAGFGLDQRKHAGSFRWSAPTGQVRYALVEYARTREFSGSVEAFDFDTWLAEGSLAPIMKWTASARLERTVRPEEERAQSFFRTVRPLHDFNIIGRTRWTTLTVNATHAGGTWRWISGRPFIEAGYHAPRATRRPAALDPVELFGARQVWMTSIGLRLHAGTMRARFGRYATSIQR